MSDFYLKEAEKSEWIREGIKRERDRILKLIDKYSEFVYTEFEEDKHINSVNLEKLKKEINNL